MTWPSSGRSKWVWPGISAASIVLGLGLMVDSALRTSATYDEVTYLEVATKWGRTGEQETITRLGSPLLFWKMQQAPVMWCIDRAGLGHVLDEPERNGPMLLPLMRLGALPFWLIAALFIALWAREAYGPRAMAMASVLFSLSPNLLAHGPLITMETPLMACSSAIFFFFWRFLRRERRRDFAICAIVCGLAFSCKYTTVLFPPILGFIWWFQRSNFGDRGAIRQAGRVAISMVVFLAIMAASNLILTGFRTTPLSPNVDSHGSIETRFSGSRARWLGQAMETPIPAEWVGFATQMRLQSEGGSSYLLGERRETGWWYYYFVCLAVKVPPTFWLLVAGRFLLDFRRGFGREDFVMPLWIAMFLTITAIGSTRNYGIRYLFPMAPVAIVWVSALAEASMPLRLLAVVGLIGQAAAIASCHPHELTYFHSLVGGSRGGRYILADSNLDWGQGLKGLVELQRKRPEFRDLTLYYFGNTSPKNYGVEGVCRTINATPDWEHVGTKPAASTEYLAVSSSLQFGPWGLTGYFRDLDGKTPVYVLDDATIAIYRAGDLGAQ